MNASALLEASSRSGGLQAFLLWLCVGVGVASCLLVFWVTVRHHRLRSRGEAAAASVDGEEPVIYDSSLLAEVFWVVVPMLMVLGLGAWALAGVWGAGGGASAAQGPAARGTAPLVAMNSSLWMQEGLTPATALPMSHPALVLPAGAVLASSPALPTA